MLLYIVYGVFILAVAAVVIFTGPIGRRLLMLAGFTGGTATLLMRFLLQGYTPAQMTLLQLLSFPVLVLGVWLSLFIVRKFRG